MKWLAALLFVIAVGAALWYRIVRRKSPSPVTIDRYTCNRCDDNDCECTRMEERKIDE